MSDEQQLPCDHCGEDLDWEGGEDGPLLCSVCADMADEMFKNRHGHSIDEELVRNWRREEP